MLRTRRLLGLRVSFGFRLLRLRFDRERANVKCNKSGPLFRRPTLFLSTNVCGMRLEQYVKLFLERVRIA